MCDYLDNAAHLSFSTRSDRPLEWVPEEPSPHKHEKLIEHYSDLHQVADLEGNNAVDIYSIHSGDVIGYGGTRWDIAICLFLFCLCKPKEKLLQLLFFFFGRPSVCSVV